MSALEIIEQIKSLPPAEFREVADFVESVAREGETAHSEASSPAAGVRYADAATFEKVTARVFTEHAELFRKLAQ